MAIMRNRTQNRYTNIANSIFTNKNLSLKDRGLLTTLLSLPDNWEFSIAGLNQILKDGKDSISTSIKNLEREGYLVRTRIKNDNGRFDGYDWEVFEEPQN